MKLYLYLLSFLAVGILILGTLSIGEFITPISGRDENTISQVLSSNTTEEVEDTIRSLWDEVKADPQKWKTIYSNGAALVLMSQISGQGEDEGVKWLRGSLDSLELVLLSLDSTFVTIDYRGLDTIMGKVKKKPEYRIVFE